MRKLFVMILISALGAACGDKSARQTPVALDAWSWLPPSKSREADAARFPPGAQISWTIPQDDPIKTKSNGWGGIDTFGNFVPTDRDSLIVMGGALVSRLGTVEKRAQWGGWDFVTSDRERKQRAGWGYSLTSGEVLLPRKAFLDPSPSLFAENSFEVAAFADDFVVIRLDSAKGHRLCFLNSAASQVPTAGCLGSKAEVGGRILERRADGWYAGDARVSK